MSDTMQCSATGETLTRATGPRPDWRFSPPKVCTHYVFGTTTDEVEKEVPMVATAYLEEGWCLFWACPECQEGGDEDGGEIDWPFLPTEYAKPEDLEWLGFTVRS